MGEATRGRMLPEAGREAKAAFNRRLAHDVASG